MFRKYIFASTLICLAGFLLVWMNCAENKAPNILLIVLDAARADHFSCYGYEKPTTPHIDRLAEDGVVFLNHHVNATLTTASLPRMFTSRYYSRALFRNTLWRWGIRRETSGSLFYRFDDEQIFLPEVMSRNGYRTCIFHNHILLRKRTQAVLGFEESKYVVPYLKRYPGDRGIVTQVIEWFKRVKGDKFFACCHIMSPHSPYPAKEEDREFLDDFPHGRVEAVRERIFHVLHNNSEGWSRRDLQILNGLYDSNLKHSDWWIGYLIDKLNHLDLLDDTVVIITSDHGENLGAHHRLGHGGPPWDSVTHVPLILYHPGRLPKGLKVSGMSESVDLMPTILGICGVSLPAGKSVDGVNLAKFFDRPDRGKAVIFTEDSVRTRSYKLIISRDQLFRYPADPEETNNIVHLEPKAKRVLLNYHEKRLGPLRERFLNARAAGPPPYPFYVAVQDMQVSPHEQIVRHRVKDLDFDRFDQMLPRTKKKWIIAAGRMAYGLIGEPGNPGENRIGLEARMPDGEYSCELLFGMLGNADEKRVSNWILYSWRQGDPFARAAKIQPLKKRFSGFRCFYLHLGKAQVRDNRFELSLQLSPHIDHKYLISHVKFIPLGMSDTTQRPKKSEEDTREELEKLKTLGYL